MNPVEVNLTIENPSLVREAFYNLCFIAESDTAPRNLVVKTLKDLLDNGYSREGLAYNFCVGVFAQQGIPSIIIRAKKTNESYIDAYKAFGNEDFYYIVVQSKDLEVISAFNNYLVNSEEVKLQFYSSNRDTIKTGNLVHYYHELIDHSKDVEGGNRIDVKDHYINKAYDLGYTTKNLASLSFRDFQRARLAYPEAAWIGKCGDSFPSKVQWLYKYLSKVDVIPAREVEALLLTKPLASTTSIILKDRATTGSGKTTKKHLIHEHISFEWVKWGISRKLWYMLYTKDKISATEGGKELVVNEIKDVLNTAVEQGIFAGYSINNVRIEPEKDSISVKFTAELDNTILNVDVSGSLYH